MVHYCDIARGRVKQKTKLNSGVNLTALPPPYKGAHLPFQEVFPCHNNNYVGNTAGRDVKRTITVP